MPIKYVHGDIFKSPCQVIVNPVNTRGRMGAGLAKQFANRYTDLERAYGRACWLGDLSTKKPWLWRGPQPWVGKKPDHWILCLATKEEWSKPSRLEYIALGLEWLVANYEMNDITSIAFPKLGCGLGQLEWSEVKEIMEIYLADLPIDVEIYI